MTSVKKFLSRAKRVSLEALFPYLCLSCRKEIAPDSTQPLCATCYEKIKPEWRTICHVCEKNVLFLSPKNCAHAKTNLESVSFVFSYQTRAVRRAIHAFKYYFVTDATNIWAEAFKTQKLNFFRLPVDVALPIPLGRAKLKERGFNQAELIAKDVAKLTQTPVITDVLFKGRSTGPQMKLKTPAQRQKNIAGAFSIKNKELIEGKNVLLVDDVITTGATLEEAARVLREAGANKVYAFVLAKD